MGEDECWMPAPNESGIWVFVIPRSLWSRLWGNKKFEFETCIVYPHEVTGSIEVRSRIGWVPGPWLRIGPIPKWPIRYVQTIEEA